MNATISMKDIFTLLRKLQAIAPETGYTERSRRLILGAETASPFRVPWRFLLRGLQFGSAIALSTLLVALLVGGLAIWKLLSPLQLSSLDPIGLRAEAEAIDLQIQLTDVAYTEPIGGIGTVPYAASAPRKNGSVAKGKQNGNVPAATSSMPAVTIDEALDKLSE